MDIPALNRPSTPPDLTGSSTDFTLEELFALFTSTEMSGMLVLGEPVEASIWITKGCVSYGTSPGTPTPKSLLVRQGIVTDPEFEGARSATKPGASLVETLFDLFDVDAKRIENVAREQILTTVFEVVVVGADTFEFWSGVEDPLGVAICMSHMDVLTEAERRRQEWQRIAQLVPSTGIVVGLRPQLPEDKQGLTITADEWQILALCNGQRTVAEIINELGLSAFEVCGVLYDLMQAKTVIEMDSET